MSRILVSGLGPDGMPVFRDPNDDDVSREYERRLCHLLGARDLAHAAFIRADDNAEIRTLQGTVTRDVVEQARLDELLASHAAVTLLIDRYNAMPSPPPLDYTDDRHWTQGTAP